MLISILRTVVPVLWGNIVMLLLSVVPALEPLRDQLLSYSEFAVPFIATVLTAAWYALCRWAEPMLPDWLTAVLLGSSKAPVYTANYDSTSIESGEPDYAAHVQAILDDEEEEALAQLDKESSAPNS